VLAGFERLGAVLLALAIVLLAVALAQAARVSRSTG